MNKHEQLRSLESRIEALSEFHASDYAIGPRFLMYSSPEDVDPSLPERFRSSVSTAFVAVSIICLVLFLMLVTPVINL